MTAYQKFIFKDWVFDRHTKQLALHYSIDDAIDFTETYTFDFPFTDNLNHQLLDQAIQTLFIMTGVSYYKTYLPPEIVIEKGQLDKTSAEFFSKAYQKGLGEFFYTNSLDPRTAIPFPAHEEATPTSEGELQPGMLIGIGGGKDSLVSVEILKQHPNLRLATWSVGHRAQLTPLVERIGLEHFWVERQWDPKLLELNDQGAYNGHVPISAILAAVGSVVAVLTDFRDVVVSNESSANESTLEYQGEPINHQYSKTSEFEADFQKHLQHTVGDAVRYYSFLRPLSEIRIAEIFAKQGFETYKDVFSSCNRAFTRSSDRISWCGECPKCAFVFLALTPFIEREKLEALWGGKNLLLDPQLEPTYRQLLGIEGDKPLECVGEIKESRTAMQMAQSQYSELAKYQFEIPEDYNYQSLSAHSMPEEVYAILTAALAGI